VGRAILISRAIRHCHRSHMMFSTVCMTMQLCTVWRDGSSAFGVRSMHSAVLMLWFACMSFMVAASVHASLINSDSTSVLNGGHGGYNVFIIPHTHCDAGTTRQTARWVHARTVVTCLALFCRCRLVRDLRGVLPR